MTLAEHIRALLAEREAYLAPPPADLPLFARSLYDEKGIERRRQAALEIDKEIAEGIVVLRAVGALPA